jgi:hypothetical protein
VVGCLHGRVSLAAGEWQNNDETPGGVPVTYERARRALSERGSISFVEGLLIVFLILGILFFLGGID